MPSVDMDSFIKKHTNCTDFRVLERVQSLWSGYGEILRIGLEGASHSSVILKKVDLATAGAHPRGWDSSISHKRKLKSYAVEWTWYSRYAKHNEAMKMPLHLGSENHHDVKFLLLEDLNSVGFPVRKTALTKKEVFACLNWLANFHAHHMGDEGAGLWETGTYWHLATRPDEFDAMTSGRLKENAAKIDDVLNGADHQTLVHGDAKLANFCFSEAGDHVAAVDFQYVGRGVGVKDVAYFLSSCLSSDQCFEHEDLFLNYYFNSLNSRILKSDNYKRVEEEWRWLYPYAWADFERFLEGWSPGHFKIHEYGKAQVDKALSRS